MTDLFGIMRAPRAVLFGNGQRHALGRVAAALGRRALICTDERFAATQEMSELLAALERAGVRVGLHAKSMVVDARVGVVGTHNFDPRGDRYNTESAIVIADPAFAQALAHSTRGDIAPGNSWTIARRPDAADRRRQLVEITPEGTVLLDADRAERDAWLHTTMRERLSTLEFDLLMLVAPILRKLADPEAGTLT